MAERDVEDGRVTDLRWRAACYRDHIVTTRRFATRDEAKAWLATLRAAHWEPVALEELVDRWWVDRRENERRAV